MTDFFINLCCGVILQFIFSPYLEHVGPKTSLTTLYSNSTQTRWCLICCSIRASYDWLAQMTSCQVVINYSCTKFAFAQNFLEWRAKIQTDLKPNVAFNSSRISETQPVAKKGKKKRKRQAFTWASWTCYAKLPSPGWNSFWSVAWFRHFPPV